MNDDISWQKSLEKLVSGNQRFVSGVRSVESIMSCIKLKELAKGQSPFAIVIACSDSRVPAEIVFDCGLGELFVIRMAGNVVTKEVIASVEFAAANFGSPLCVVMGHSSCGAVNAAINVFKTKQKPSSPHIQQLLHHIDAPLCACVEKVGLQSSALMDLVIEENVAHAANVILEESDVIRDLVSQGKFQIVGGIYNLSTGSVQFQDSSSHVPPLKKGVVRALHA